MAEWGYLIVNYYKYKYINYNAGLTNKSIFLVEFKEPYAEKKLRDETTPNIRGIVYSPKGNYLAYRTDRK